MCLWEYFAAFCRDVSYLSGGRKIKARCDCCWCSRRLISGDLFQRLLRRPFFIWIDSIGLKMCRLGHSATGRRKSGKRVSQRLAETRLRQRLKEGKFFLDSKKPFFCKKLLTIRAASSSMRSIFWLFYKRRRAKLKWRKPRPSLSYAVVLALFCKTEMFCESGLLC